MSEAVADGSLEARRPGPGRAWDESPLDLPTPHPDEIAHLTAAAIERANGRIDAAVATAAQAEATGEAPAFEALFGALDDAAREIGIAFGLGASQSAMASDDDVRDAAFAANEQLEKWRASVPMRDDLAAAVQRFVDRDGLEPLDDLDRRYVERWRKDIRLAGGELPADQREAMSKLTLRLLEVGSAFASNLSKSPHVRLTRPEAENLPEGARGSVEPVAGDPESFDLEVNGGVYLQVMEREPDRALRERVYRAWSNRGVPENLELLAEAAALRRGIARLAGYPSWQAFRVEDLAAPAPAFINGFIGDLSSRLEPVVRRQVADMTRVLRQEPGATTDLVLQDWDWRYADTILREELGVDQDRLSEYFELEQVLDGLKTLSAEVFGIGLEPHPERVAWDPAVRPFDVVDVATGAVLAHLFVDPWARPGKQPGAWMETLLPGGGRHGERRPPTLALVLNVAPPGDGPALLPAIEVETLFHEFGHVMNFACGAGRFVVHRSQWSPFDFVEGPSEFNGRWGLQPDVVRRFARHHRTAEPIPAELVAALVRSESLNAAIELQRLLVFARFDALIHGEADVSIDAALREGWKLRGLPYVEGTSLPASLGHILGGAYDAALYGYGWSKVIRDDLLERFTADGLTSPETGARYRQTILEVSWIEDPVAAVDAFLGRPWSFDAFLRRAESVASPASSQG